MSKQSNEELIKLIKAGIDVQDNYEQLYKQNHRFIYLLIKRKVHGIYEVDDLMQQSFFALVKAVDYYDCEREEKAFLQILKYCIWNEIRNSASEVPAHMQYKIVKYRMAYSKLYNELGYKPRTYELMQELNISLQELELIRAAVRNSNPVSLDEPINEEGDVSRMDLYSESKIDEDDPYDEVLNRLVKSELGQMMYEEIDKLPKLSKEVIYKRIVQCKTLERVGQEYNVTRERIRQIETKALRKIRNNARFVKKVRDYMEINEYKQVGSRQFNTTHISAVEWLVIEREKIGSREQEISSWLNK